MTQKESKKQLCEMQAHEEIIVAGINNENFVLLLRKNLVVLLNLEENIPSSLKVEETNLKTLVAELIKILNNSILEKK